MTAVKLIDATDCVVICWVFGAAAIVPYYVAQRLCQFITKPLQFIGQVCLPRAGELYAKGQLAELRELLARGMGLSWLLTMSFFIGASFFGPVLIETWVHKPYPHSQVLLLVLLVYSYVVWSHIPLEPGWPLMLAISAGGAAVLAATWFGQHKLVNGLNGNKLDIVQPQVSAE